MIHPLLPLKREFDFLHRIKLTPLIVKEDSITISKKSILYVIFTCGTFGLIYFAALGCLHLLGADLFKGMLQSQALLGSSKTDVMTQVCKM